MRFVSTALVMMTIALMLLALDAARTSCQFEISWCKKWVTS